jgi:hypothetical protein
MGKKIAKGMTMLVLLLAVALMAAVGTASGQSRQKLIANVPFDFIVGDQVLDAGRYTVNAVGIAGDALAIQGADGNNAIRLSYANQSHANKTARLVFHRYGNTYFLSQVWQGVDNVGRQLLKSREELAMERELGRIAANTNSEEGFYEEVVVLARVR